MTSKIPVNMNKVFIIGKATKNLSKRPNFFCLFIILLIENINPTRIGIKVIKIPIELPRKAKIDPIRVIRYKKPIKNTPFIIPNILPAIVISFLFLINLLIASAIVTPLKLF